MVKSEKVEKVNKAEAIRNALKELGNDASNKDVIAHLTKQKIEVASAQISNIKADINGGSGNRKRRKAAIVITNDDLVVAKDYAVSVGTLTARDVANLVIALQLGDSDMDGAVHMGQNYPTDALFLAKGFVAKVGVEKAPILLEALNALQVGDKS